MEGVVDQTRDALSAAADTTSVGSVDDEEAAPVRPASTALRSALRRARVQSAERADVVADLRSAEAARLDMLREHLAPVFDELPEDCDMFDLGLAPGDHPRLFIDMIAFVEMARDRRAYRFVQDTRRGRILLAENESIDATVRAVADYLARRLVEREKALAADVVYASQPAAAPDAPVVPAAPAAARERRASAAAPLPVYSSEDQAQAAERAMRSVNTGAHPPPRSRPGALRVIGRIFLFFVEVLGSAAFFAVLAAAGYWLWMKYGG